MSRRPVRSFLAAAAALAFAANMGVVPALVGACAHHGPQATVEAEETLAASSHHAEHETPHGHEAPHEHDGAPGDDHDCLCLGDCCPGDTKSTAPLGNAPELRAHGTRIAAAPLPSQPIFAPRPRLLPFANAPPAIT